jgi:hypothetical protein
MKKQISYDDLERSGFLKEIETELSRFSVGFVKLVDRHGKEDMFHAGSGTMVQIHDRFGILTADHVLQNLTSSQVGVILPSLGPKAPHRIIINLSNAQKLHIGPATNSASGPDLGICMLHAHDVAKLETWSAFYNLAKRRESMLMNPRDLKAGGWFLCGAPDEWTTEAEPDRAFTKIKSFRGFCGAAVVTTERITSEFDYLDVDIAPKGKYEGPLNFEGVSGGGLWQVVIEEQEGQIRIVEYLLSGVAFYQLFESGLPRTIVCHGRRSIYESLFRKLPHAS